MASFTEKVCQIAGKHWIRPILQCNVRELSKSTINKISTTKKNGHRRPARKSGFFGAMIEACEDNETVAIFKRKFRCFSQLWQLKPHELAEKNLQFYDEFVNLLKTEGVAVLLRGAYGKSLVNIFALYISCDHLSKSMR